MTCRTQRSMAVFLRPRGERAEGHRPGPAVWRQLVGGETMQQLP